MKYETTKKAIRQSESRVISVGYGALQYALSCLSPVRLLCRGVRVELRLLPPERS